MDLPSRVKVPIANVPLEPSRGETKADTGRVWSILNDFVFVVRFPAVSVVRKATVCGPSAETAIIVPGSQLPPSTWYSVRAIPLVASKTVAVTVTSETYQSASPIVPESAVASEGAVVSTCRPIVSANETADRLPALSVALASTVCSPSLSNRLFPVVQFPPSRQFSMNATPLSASTAFTSNETGLMYQPFAPKVPDGVKVTDGGVLSTLKLSEVVERSPAWSAARKSTL